MLFHVFYCDLQMNEYYVLYSPQSLDSEAQFFGIQTIDDHLSGTYIYVRSNVPTLLGRIIKSVMRIIVLPRCEIMSNFDNYL